jgi:CRISPR/Cas system type I-B associated protein Csh2 (Cas7 group RAMP superfamily)
MNRATGLLVIEVTNSNPNGNPDQESNPRLRPDERGMISPVSFKRKLRDLVEDKEGPVWKVTACGFFSGAKSRRLRNFRKPGKKAGRDCSVETGGV